jgi:hypothetical protein
VIGRPPRRPGTDPLEAEHAQIQIIDEDVDHPNRIILRDEIIQAFRQETHLVPGNPLNKPLHGRTALNVIAGFYHIRVFTQPGPRTDIKLRNFLPLRRGSRPSLGG